MLLLTGLIAACAQREVPLEGTVLVPRGATWQVGVDPELALPPLTPALAADQVPPGAFTEVRAPLGFGDDDIATEVARPADADQAAIFLRHAFEVAAPDEVKGLVLELRVDDGARVFLNGSEVLRSNMVGGRRIDAQTRAPRSIGGDEEDRFVRHALPAGRLRAGRNLLAVALHNTRPDGDLVFDAALIAQAAEDAPLLLRGPYLQRLTDTSVSIRFTTSRETVGRVRFVTQPDGQTQVSAESPRGLEHEIVLEGLEPGTEYGYGIDADGFELAGLRHHCAFRTAPTPGQGAPLRLWVTGDPGTGNKYARAVRDAYQSWAGRRPADLWLSLGDSAYPSGTPADWQANFFDVYGRALRRTPFLPAVGNHDVNAVSPLTGETHLFEAMTLPDETSGTESYHEARWGRVQLLALDSDKSDRTPTGPMLRWLAERVVADADAIDWRVVYLHHTPFSRGTHHDDRELQSRDIRAHAVPILEQAGVDLVLSGHSHGYERSHLLRGPHPGTWHFEAGRTAAQAEREDGVDVHRTGEGGQEGTLYVVAGSAGQTGPGTYDHPNMAVSFEGHGSLVIDIDGCRLDARFVDDEGEVRDAFAIEKGAPCRVEARAAPVSGDR